MNIKKLLFLVLIALGNSSFAMDNPYQDVQPMELELSTDSIQDQPIHVPSLRHICLESVVPVLSTWFQNDDSAAKLAQLPNDVQEDLWHMIMFDNNEPRFKRNRAIVWLAQASPVVNEFTIYQGEMFAVERRVCNQMSVSTDVAKWYLGNPCPLQVINTQTNDSVMAIEFEAPVVNAQFSENGKFLYVVDKDKHVDIFCTDSWDSINSTELHYRLKSLKFSLLTPDNNLVLCGSGNKLSAYDILTGEVYCDLICHSPELISGVKIARDGNEVYVFYVDAGLNNAENCSALMNWIGRPVIHMRKIDISLLSAFCKQIPKLTLEQLLALELFHKVVQGNDEIVLKQKHIINAYVTLPAQIKKNLEKVMPNIQNILGIENIKGAESENKKRKKDSDKHPLQEK